MPSKKDAAYWREYRAKKKAQEEEVRGVVAETKDATLYEVSVVKDPSMTVVYASKEPDIELAADIHVLDLDAPIIRKSDRERGLPRSNYYGPTEGKGGWTEVIQNIDPQLTTKILDRIAPPRRPRS